MEGEQTGGPQQISERNSLDRLSAERCLGGPSRSWHGEGNRQHSRPERMLDLSLEDSTMPNLPQQRDRLQPSETLFNTLPFPLTDGISKQ